MKYRAYGVGSYDLQSSTSHMWTTRSDSEKIPHNKEVAAVTEVVGSTPTRSTSSILGKYGIILS